MDWKNIRRTKSRNYAEWLQGKKDKAGIAEKSMSDSG
jgi:hypothetical protein